MLAMSRWGRCEVEMGLEGEDDSGSPSCSWAVRCGGSGVAMGPAVTKGAASKHDGGASFFRSVSCDGAGGDERPCSGSS